MLLKTNNRNFLIVIIVFAVTNAQCGAEEHDYSGTCEDRVAYNSRSVNKSCGDGVEMDEPHTCSDIDYCVIANDKAICALQPTIDPRCPTDGFVGYCDSNTFVLCSAGIPWARYACRECDVSAKEICTGELWSSCSNEPCGNGLVCGEEELCVATCECPAGEPCPACELVRADAYQEATCESGLCSWKER